MENKRLNRLKELLAVPTKTYEEDGMVEYILSLLNDIDGIEYFTDKMNNVYVTKGDLDDGESYPMFLAHTDTVHELVDKIVVKEQMIGKYSAFGHRIVNEEDHLSLIGKTKNGRNTGIGGDDKNGIFIVIELLKILPKMKAGFFVSEETGCHGSSKCDINFLKDVGYAIQFDAPGDNLITEICSGIRLFEKDGEFINKILPIFEKGMGNVKADLQIHPYTDISQIKRKGDFSCINLSCGYYKMHSKDEIVVVDDVENSINVAVELYTNLGLNKYEYESEQPSYGSHFRTIYEENVYGTHYKDNNVEMVDIETDNVILMNESSGVTIESKYTDDKLFLNDDDLIELYDIIRERLINSYTY